MIINTSHTRAERVREMMAKVGLRREHYGRYPHMTRCPRADARCRAERPQLRQFDGRRVACHHAEAIAQG